MHHPSLPLNSSPSPSPLASFCSQRSPNYCLVIVRVPNATGEGAHGGNRFCRPLLAFFILLLRFRSHRFRREGVVTKPSQRRDANNLASVVGVVKWSTALHVPICLVGTQ